MSEVQTVVKRAPWLAGPIAFVIVACGSPSNDGGPVDPTSVPKAGAATAPAVIPIEGDAGVQLHAESPARPAASSAADTSTDVGPSGAAPALGSAHGETRGTMAGGAAAKPAAESTDSKDGGLSSEQVRRFVLARAGAVRACHQAEAVRAPGLSGQVTVGWQIAAAGNVTRASVARSTLKSPPVEECIVREVKTWKFPTSKSPTTVESFAFAFRSGG